jgi:hypothetical protein
MLVLCAQVNMIADVTLSVYPHRAGLKNMPGHGGIRTYDLWNQGRANRFLVGGGGGIPKFGGGRGRRYVPENKSSQNLLQHNISQKIP